VIKSQTYKTQNTKLNSEVEALDRLNVCLNMYLVNYNSAYIRDRVRNLGSDMGFLRSSNLTVSL